MRKVTKWNSEPFKIGLLITSVEFGGLDQVVKGLIDNVDREKYTVVPVVFRARRGNSNTLLLHLDKMGFEYSNIIVNNHRIKYFNPIANIAQTYRACKNYQFDLIHTHGYRADVIGYIVAKAFGLPILATCHGFIPNDKKLMLYNKLDRFVLRFFDRVIAVSDGIAHSLANAGVKERKIGTIPNAVFLSGNETGSGEVRSAKRNLMGWKDHDFGLGYVGRLSEEKGVKFLIEATSALLGDDIPVKLVLMGDGPQRQELELLSKKRGISESVFFLGFRMDVQSWLPTLDVFILPSLMEGTPLALLEAMLHGIPVVASNVGGVPNIVESGKNGILVEPGNPEAIRGAISQLYQDRDMRLRIGKEAQATVEGKYNMQDWIHKVEAEYMKALEG